MIERGKINIISSFHSNNNQLDLLDGNKSLRKRSIIYSGVVETDVLCFLWKKVNYLDWIDQEIVEKQIFLNINSFLSTSNSAQIEVYTNIESIPWLIEIDPRIFHNSTKHLRFIDFDIFLFIKQIKNLAFLELYYYLLLTIIQRTLSFLGGSCGLVSSLAGYSTSSTFYSSTSSSSSYSSTLLFCYDKRSKRCSDAFLSSSSSSSACSTSSLFYMVYSSAASASS